jgi:hypothetical protein
MKRPFSERESQALFSLRALGLLSSLVLVPALAGCPGTLDPGFLNAGSTGTGGMMAMAGGTGGAGNTGGPPCDAPAMVFTPSCVAASCHKNGAGVGIFPPEFSAAKYPTFKSTAVLNPTGPCNGKNIIDPGSPATSPLLIRIMGADCGDQMPDKAIDATVNYLTPDQISCVSSWISAND